MPLIESFVFKDKVFKTSPVRAGRVFSQVEAVQELLLHVVDEKRKRVHVLDENTVEITQEWDSEIREGFRQGIRPRVKIYTREQIEAIRMRTLLPGVYRVLGWVPSQTSLK